MFVIVIIALALLLIWRTPRFVFVPLGPSWAPRFSEPLRLDGPMLKSLFSGPPKPKKAPAFIPPPVMPEVDDAAVQRAKRRAIVDQQARSGRLSTVLTDTADASQTLGG